MYSHHPKKDTKKKETPKHYEGQLKTQDSNRSRDREIELINIEMRWERKENAFNARN